MSTEIAKDRGADGELRGEEFLDRVLVCVLVVVADAIEDFRDHLWQMSVQVFKYVSRNGRALPEYLQWTH